MHRWIVVPNYFETPEPALTAIAPDDAVVSGPHDLPDRSPGSMAVLHDPIRDFTARTALDGDMPVILAGDCCASIPVVAGLQKAGIAPVLVWIDAHGDFNTPETSPSQFLGGMPLAMIVGRGPQEMSARHDLSALREEDVWLIDARDLDPLEREAVDASALRRTGIAGLATLALDRPVHLHLDIDVIRAEDAPAMNYPVPGGPGTHEVARACSAFAALNDLAALSISGWNGALDTDGRSRDATATVVRAILGA